MIDNEEKAEASKHKHACGKYFLLNIKMFLQN